MGAYLSLASYNVSDRQVPVTASAPTLVWLRKDLRLHDNPALVDAASGGGTVIPVFVLDDESADMRRFGAASRWWLHGSLAALGGAFAELGSRLILRRGDAAQAIDALLTETGAGAVVWNRCYEPEAIARDRRIKAALKDRGVAARSHQAGLLFEPWTIRTKAGDPYRVYTPFWRACRDIGVTGCPLPAPSHLPPPAAWPMSDRLDDWALRPTKPDWAGGLRATWSPGEQSALERCQAFLDDGLGAYADQRNRPDVSGTSALSPHLHWGEIGPRQVWSAIAMRLHDGSLAGRENQIEAYRKQLIWREFSYHLLFHYPKLPETPLNPRFSDFPWQESYDSVQAWRRGRTGFPIVDAGMRQLWHSGWMHNRVRMIVASFLIKHLLQPWQIGEDWFWDTLVDADLANNAASWQWVAGCGADAAPYFRIFNPVLQGEKFDPNGHYVRHWLPELAALPAAVIHKPWSASEPTLRQAGVRLGDSYPKPIVDHHAARNRALAAFETVKG